MVNVWSLHGQCRCGLCKELAQAVQVWSMHRACTESVGVVHVWSLHKQTELWLACEAKIKTLMKGAEPG